MDDIEEKRVFGERAGKSELLVAAAIGLLSVEVSADRVGRFGVAHRCEPVDVAAGAGFVGVGTPVDVLVRGPGAETFLETGFGPSVAVGIDDGVIAAGPEGRLARLDVADSGDGPNRVRTGDWSAIGELAGEVRAIDPPLVATSEGVYRLPDLDYVGLDDANDVAAVDPLVATGDGLYTLGNGWMDELDGEFQVVGSDGDRAHAATAEAFYERRAEGWVAVDLQVDGPIVDVAYGTATYAVTADGVLLAGDGNGLRDHPIGADGVVGCVIV